MEPAPAKAGGGYCYLPLYVFCGRHLLAAKLRRANIDASAGAVEEVARIVAHLRRRWPHVRILLRADSGFAREPLMAWCEANGIDDVIGLARNTRLAAEIAVEMIQAEAEAERTKAPARRFRDFRYATLDSWSCRRRVVGKAEWTHAKANPRFVVTSLSKAKIGTRDLYERLYCARGEMENRLKECQGELFADRTSTATMGANQLRLWFASMAYVPMCALRRIGPAAYRARDSDLRHDPPPAPEDRRAGQDERAPHQDRHGLDLSRRAGVAPGRRSPSAGARLAGLTRAAAPRHEPQNPRPTGAPLPTQTHANRRSPRHDINRSLPRSSSNHQAGKDPVRYPG